MHGVTFWGALGHLLWAFSLLFNSSGLAYACAQLRGWACDNLSRGARFTRCFCFQNPKTRPTSHGHFQRIMYFSFQACASSAAPGPNSPDLHTRVWRLLTLGHIHIDLCAAICTLTLTAALSTRAHPHSTDA